jgi:tetratricopeptide (TPR) repeat protein
LLFEVGAGRLKLERMLHLRLMAKLAALVVCLGGCIPGDSRVDEEKDPHFQRGINLVNSQDFPGAVEEFETALETNPRSAAAHFQLGCLYDTKVNDSAAAIYHYQKYLLLEPQSDRASLVQQRIRLCKQELANTEFPLPNSQNFQRELDRLTMENVSLRQQLAALRRPAPAKAESPPPSAQPGILSTSAPSATSLPVASHPHLHVVKQRETMSSIAAQYGLKCRNLLAANPRVDPRRLRIGQSLNLP